MAENNVEDILIENKNGVFILKSERFAGHFFASNAVCKCGERMLIAPEGFNAKHEKGDPVLVCEDHGIHSFMFSTLIIGEQLTADRL